MEQFEKWKNKNCEDKGCPHEASCNNCEITWRAALEWALGRIEDGSISYEQGHIEIEQELGDT